MVRYAIMLGQLTGGPKATRSGFFFGGAGYLMGPRVIAKLKFCYHSDHAMSVCLVHGVVRRSVESVTAVNN